MVEPHTKPGAVQDEELDELPPMDGDSDDDADAEADADDLDADPDAASLDPLDDKTGEGDPLEEMEFGGSESGWLEDAADADGLDVGGAEIDGEEDESSDLLQGTEEPGVEDEDFALGADEAQPLVDAGEEGFDGEEEDLHEEDLPRLDSGDDDEADDVDLGGDGWILAHDDAEEARPAWTEHPWEPAGAPVQLPAGAIDAVACAGRGVIAAGAGVLSRVDLEGGAEALEALGLHGGAMSSLFVETHSLIVSTARAGVLASRDGGATFADANGWRSAVQRSDADAALEIAWAGGELWGRTASGALVRSLDAGRSWAVVALEHRVVAIAVDPRGRLVALTRTPEGIALGRASEVGESGLVWSPLPALPPVPPRTPIALVVRGEHVAVRIEGRGVFRAARTRVTGEDGWSRLAGTGGATAATFADDEGTLLVALYSATEERSWLVQARGASVRVVAELGETPFGEKGFGEKGFGEKGLDDTGLGEKELGEKDDPEARVRSLVWDDAHGVAWAAGGFGLVALHPPPATPR